MSNLSAFILLDAPASLSGSAISQSLKERHPGLPVVAPIDADGDNTGAIVLNVAGSVVAVMPVAASLPDGWQLAASRAVMHWPEAEVAFGRHRAHIAVYVMGDIEDRLQAVQIVTALIGAVIVTCPSCTGVLWDLTVANSSQVFAELSSSAFTPELPSALWVSMHPFRDPGSPRVGVVTMGLRNFIGREIELEAAASQFKTALTTARGLLAYLLQPGVELRDGDTIGASATERIVVRLVTSRRFESLPVIAVNLPAA